MLEDYRDSYQTCANLIPNWRKIDKNELCREYLKHADDNQLQQAYLSAIICKYWGLISKYYSLSYNVATYEDVYEWLVDAIDYALKHHSWTREDSSIYKDPNGPDKVINRCMKCRRLTYYQAINRQKRKDGVLSLSLDELSEETNDCNDYIEDLETVNEFSNNMLNEYIKTIFDKKDYFLAVMMDCIAYQDVFEYKKVDGVVKSQFSIKKLIKRLNEIDDIYFTEFAKRYGIDKQKIADMWFKYCYGMSSDTLKEKIDFNLHTLRHSAYFSA